MSGCMTSMCCNGNISREIWGPYRDPRAFHRDPRAFYRDPRAFHRDPRAFYIDPRAFYRDPRAFWATANSSLRIMRT